MNFILDESAEARIAVFLNDQGHNATRVGKDYPKSIPDEEVLEIALAEQRILITNDKDFGELIFHQLLPHPGVILFRFPLDSNAEQKIASLGGLLRTHQEQLESGGYLTVTPRGVRVGQLR